MASTSPNVLSGSVSTWCYGHSKSERINTDVLVCSVGAMTAVVQGMDETVVNGAQLFYIQQLGLSDNAYIQGLVNGAPYLACAVAGVWLNVFLSNWFGRRGSICKFHLTRDVCFVPKFMFILSYNVYIVIGCTMGVAASLWQAFSPSWQVSEKQTCALQ
jgi:MFS family permease